MIVSVDFDGTCVTHEFPKTGKDIGAEIVLKALVDEGHKIICVSMRSEEHPDTIGVNTIRGIKDWFKKHKIKLYAINDNPSQYEWSCSRKIYAHTYIDDQFLGCPLKVDFSYSERPFVHWLITAAILQRIGFLSLESFDKIRIKLEEKYPELYLTKNKSEK